MFGQPVHHLAVVLLLASICLAEINRTAVVMQFNPNRDHSYHDTPMQVGNGNFAFGADATGLQSIKPFNTLSSWGWHNSPSPGVKTIKRDVHGAVELLDCAWLHGKALIKGVLPASFEQSVLPEETATIEDWEKRNPHRINLARIGLLWDGREMEQWEVSQVDQTLEMHTGILRSSFVIYNQTVDVETVVSPLFDVVAFAVRTNALIDGSLQFFLDFPYPVEKKFEEPFMGVYNMTERHKTTMKKWGQSAEIKHDIDDTTYYTNVRWSASRALPNFAKRPQRHRYVLNSSDIVEMTFSVRFSLDADSFTPSFDDVKSDSKWWWQNYWKDGAFVDCTATDNPRAQELQRRTLLSQYLMAVNAAGEDPPQEAGLVNNGWYGKFHMESVWWHLAHWERWNKWERIGTAIPYIYRRLMSSSIKRATAQGFRGARWGEVIDPSGNASPGLDSLLIWQQPHPFYFAEQEYLAYPEDRTLAKWKDILDGTAAFMTSFAKFNSSTKKYDLGPPLELAGENTNLNSTKNPTFELAYWRFGLHIASQWYSRQRFPVPENISKVYEQLASFPIQNDSYIQYEGVQNMWTDSRILGQHPALVGIFGWLPPDPRLNLTILQNTLVNVYQSWDYKKLYGWDFPLLAMTAVRMGDPDRAVDLLLDERFKFDDVGMPLGNRERGVPTPYFPSSGGLLMSVAMLADGWKEIRGRHWPKGWTCEAEGFAPGI